MFIEYGFWAKVIEKDNWLPYFCKMYKKDQIKGLVAIILFSIIGVTYFLSDSKDLLLTISIVAFIIWLISLYVLNRRF